jgi:hypothetical protein
MTAAEIDRQGGNPNCVSVLYTAANRALSHQGKASNFTERSESDARRRTGKLLPNSRDRFRADRLSERDPQPPAETSETGRRFHDKSGHRSDRQIAIQGGLLPPREAILQFTSCRWVEGNVANRPAAGVRGSYRKRTLRGWKVDGGAFSRPGARAEMVRRPLGSMPCVNHVTREPPN